MPVSCLFVIHVCFHCFREEAAPQIGNKTATKPAKQQIKMEGGAGGPLPPWILDGPPQWPPLAPLHNISGGGPANIKLQLPFT